MSGRVVDFDIARRRRRHGVERQLLEAKTIIDAALAGDIYLEEGVCGAMGALRPAEREVLRAAIE